MFEKGFVDRFRTSGLGPGGWRCVCCGPGKNSKNKKKWIRRAKRGALKHYFSALIKNNIWNDSGRGLTPALNITMGPYKLN
jgi:hypothetical protein